ncbi:hypothetical protein [Lactobacillus delbrueckii]|uniref:hypothetical protein n=1 Tax=Lactobacillus delbrueckii TaxID=1584 RepID=UPI000680C5FB|nr:hypothetical protein [Lactobacillus delbrueckii]TXG08879.1 hypothetical protein FU323_02540 [Lactobacillus delbrueckii subsp. bulgaricus]APP02578.1 hypothetical protein LI610_02835 [Lactobacillus delbrueckii subsp. indicus]KNE31080.1 hypothetical protein LDI10_02460 [Lactobacillus delbrueckii subsp. indicus]KRL72939.1 hypothetical protein FC09_GL000970 [Lactobacillus delbrueckii subsp. indicus DSM 15996]MDF4029694.1 hypothetical protein [Lactobacillus delbrueckii]
MMNNNLYLKILWVLLYGIVAVYTFTDKTMMAMYWMAGVMFAQAVLDLVYYFLPKSKTEMTEC